MPDLTWLDAGTAWFEERVRAVDLDRPSALPGWTGRHVAAHVAANADAIGRLVRWARTGVETPMYASPEARDAEIEELARLGGAELVELVRTTAADLRGAIGGLPEACWGARVRTAQGRDVAAAEVVWMRTREVWVHGADLGGRFDDFPPALLDALVEDVLRAWDARGQGPWMTLHPVDRPVTWHTAPPTPPATSALDPTGTEARSAAGPTGAEARSAAAAGGDAGSTALAGGEARGAVEPVGAEAGRAVEAVGGEVRRSVEAVSAVGAPVVRGTAAELAAWVTGRGPAPSPDAPAIGRWL